MVTERQKQQHKVIRADVKDGKSTNQIQKHLQQEHVGMRRKTLLRYVRQVKDTKQKPQPYKYTRKVYKKRIVAKAVAEFQRQLRQKAYEFEKKEKHVVAYGKRDGKTYRIEMSGSGKYLGSLMIDVVKHPPRKRFTVLKNVGYMSPSKRTEILDFEDRWDDRPTITS